MEEYFPLNVMYGWILICDFAQKFLSFSFTCIYVLEFLINKNIPAAILGIHCPPPEFSTKLKLNV